MSFGLCVHFFLQMNVNGIVDVIIRCEPRNGNQFIECYLKIEVSRKVLGKDKLIEMEHTTTLLFSGFVYVQV